MLERMHAVRALGAPYLVAEEGGRIVGYSYATLYRARSAYRFTLEDSVYVREGCGGRGVGRALLQELIEGCRKGIHQRLERNALLCEVSKDLELHGARLGLWPISLLQRVDFSSQFADLGVQMIVL